jgi:pimeloyl-ACP methyl ester carboxylesterase
MSPEPPTQKELRPMLKAWLPAASQHDLTFLHVGRRGDHRSGTSAEEIADEYAAVIRAEVGGPVGVMGYSTGGAYAMWLAIRHPDLVDRLVLGFTAHRLPPETRVLQRRFTTLIEARRWRSAYRLLGPVLFPRHARIAGAAFWLLGPVLGGRPKDTSVLPIDTDAEEAHDATARLGDIRCPTLVVSGEVDPGYPAPLVRELVGLIPDARHVEYRGVGHQPPGEPLAREASAFLAGGR